MAGPKRGLQTIKAMGASGLGKHHHARSMLSPQVEALSPHLALVGVGEPDNPTMRVEARGLSYLCV